MVNPRKARKYKSVPPWYQSPNPHTFWSHKRKFCFIHVPKTAGTSMEIALFRGSSRNKHQTALARRKEHPVAWKAFFTFGFVRNPWDWVVSRYTHMADPKLKRQWNVFKTVYPRFGDYLEAIDNPEDDVKRRAKVLRRINRGRMAHKLGPIKTQKHFLFDGPSTPGSTYSTRPAPKGNNQLVDFVGRFENLEVDWDHVRNTIGGDIPSLPHRTKSKRETGYRQYYMKDGNAEIVARAYKEDIEEFGYTF